MIREVENSYTLSELCRICNLEKDWVIEMIDYEVIIVDTQTEVMTEAVGPFNEDHFQRIMKAWRLQSDLGLNVAGVALAMQLLEKIDEQEKELKLLRRLQQWHN